MLHLLSRFFRLVLAEILLCCQVPAIPNTPSLVCSFAKNNEKKKKGGVFCLVCNCCNTEVVPAAVPEAGSSVSLGLPLA